MAHHNNTPANVLTAPSFQPALVAGSYVEIDERGNELHPVQLRQSEGYVIDPETTVITNPKKRAEKNRRAAEKRVRRNDRNAKKGTGR